MGRTRGCWGRWWGRCGRWRGGIVDGGRGALPGGVAQRASRAAREAVPGRENAAHLRDLPQGRRFERRERFERAEAAFDVVGRRGLAAR